MQQVSRRALAGPETRCDPVFSVRIVVILPLYATTADFKSNEIKNWDWRADLQL